MEFTCQDFFLPCFFFYCSVILESAWSLHDRTFFDNVGTVLIYAVIVSMSSVYDLLLGVVHSWYYIVILYQDKIKGLVIQ